MTHKELEGQVELYGERLANFIEHYALPEEWFAVPDHIAIKCATRTEFERQIEELRAYTTEPIKGKDMHGRTLGTVVLADAISIGSFGAVNIVEVMEPRPEKANAETTRFEHAEFYFPDFAGVVPLLNESGISHDMSDDNPMHRCIEEIIISDELFELKLNDRQLGDIVGEETLKSENYDL